MDLTERMNVPLDAPPRFLLAMHEERMEDALAIFNQYEPFFFACAMAGGWTGVIAARVGEQNLSDVLRGAIDRFTAV